MKTYLLYAVCLLSLCYQCTPDEDWSPVSVKSLETRSGGDDCSSDDLIEWNVTACGVSRYFYVQLPAGFHPDSTYPLLFAFHGQGSGSSNKACAWKERIGDWIDENKFIGVYPRAYLDNYWYVGPPMPDDFIPEICFVNKIKDQMIDHYPINTSKIFAMGTSNGGGLCYHLARSVDWLAAIVPLAASTWEGYDLDEAIQIPLMHIHGDLDGTINYNGGLSPGIGLDFKPAYIADSLWAVDNNDCLTNSQHTTLMVGAQTIYKTSWGFKKIIPHLLPIAIFNKKEVIHYRLHNIHHLIYAEISPDTKNKMNDDIFAFLKRRHL